jgi:hypothetical protein
MGTAISRDGTIVSWSPFFNWSSIEALEASTELPLPSGKTYIHNSKGYSPNLNDKTLNLINKISLVRGKAVVEEDTFNDPELIHAFANLLIDIDNNVTNNEVAIPIELIEFINTHNTYKLNKAR